jgi:hypothetical protein
MTEKLAIVVLTICLAVAPVIIGFLIWYRRSLPEQYRAFYLVVSAYFTFVGVVVLVDIFSLGRYEILYWKTAHFLLGLSIWSIFWSIPNLIFALAYLVLAIRTGKLKSKDSAVLFSAAMTYLGLSIFYFWTAATST